MASVEDIAAATKIVSDDPESVMRGSPSKSGENRARVSSPRKCDVVSESDAAGDKEGVESEIVVESTVDVNGSEGELVKDLDEKNEIGEDALVKNGECYEKLNGGEGADVMDVDREEIMEGNVESLKNEDGGFRVGDIVWGKIKSHPWWPGQVYDPKDASEFARSRKQDGRLLVAFFGDGSCSWCSPSQLIPFVDNFPEMSRDSSSKSFLNAVERATDEVARIMELEMTCKCIAKEKKEVIAKPEVTNAGLKAGVVMPEVDVGRLSLPKYEPADVLEKVKQLAKAVSVESALDLAVLRSWLSAFYYFEGGHLLPVYHAPFEIEGLEDKTKDANGAADDFSVPIEVPILGPQEDDWLSSPNAGSVNSQNTSENKVLHKRKQRSVAEIMGENKSAKPESRKLASAKDGTDAEKPVTTRKQKKDSDGELKEAVSEQPSSTGKREKKRKAEVSVSPKTTNAKEDAEKPITTRKQKKDSNGELKEAVSEQPSSTGKREKKKMKKRKAEVSVSPKITNAKVDGPDGGTGGKLSRKPKEIDISGSDNTSEAREDSEMLSTPRERKKSKYLSPPYTNPAWRVGNSSFKFESQAQIDEAIKRSQAEEHTKGQDAAASEPISMSVDNKSQEKLPSGESLSTSVETGTQTVKDDKKLSFPTSDVDVPVNELLSEIQHAALDPFYLSKKGSLDLIWAFVSALRSSTFLHGEDSKTYLKRHRKSLPSQPRDVSNEEKTVKSLDQSTSKASKTPKKSNTKKSKKPAETRLTETSTEAKQGKTPACLVLYFTPRFPLPSKKEVVGLFEKFGSINPKETKVEKETHSIRIVYTNESDSEAAFKSSLKKCPFGSENVNYELQLPPTASKPRKSHPKVSDPPKKAPEQQEEASDPPVDLVLDLKTIKQKLEITTAIVENYHSKFSSEDKSSLKDEMTTLMEKIETFGDMVRVIAEKSKS